MQGSSDTNKEWLVNRFWHNYLSILEKFTIPAKAILWYRKHIEEYISAHQGVKLQHHIPMQVDDYLNAKGRINTPKE